MLSAKNSSPRVIFLALGEEFFAESYFFGSRWRILRREFFSSPRIFYLALGEELFAERPRGGSRQRKLLTAKGRFPVVNIHEFSDAVTIAYAPWFHPILPKSKLSCTLSVWHANRNTPGARVRWSGQDQLVERQHTLCGVDGAIHHARAIDDRERPAVGIETAGWACRRRRETDDIPWESFHQEAPEVTKSSDLCWASRPRATPRTTPRSGRCQPPRYLPLRQRDAAARPRQGPFGAEAGEREVGQHEQGQGRRKPAVDARRGAPRTAGRRSAASRGPRRGGGGRPRRLGCPPGGPRTAVAAAPPPRRAFVSRTLEARAHFVEHLVCAAFAAAAANDRDALPPLRTQTGRCACWVLSAEVPTPESMAAAGAALGSSPRGWGLPVCGRTAELRRRPLKGELSWAGFWVRLQRMVWFPMGSGY
jgi:hypothetical protein